MSGPPQLTESTFKESVRTYIELHDELTRSSKTLRDMKKKKDELGSAILAFMRDNEIDEFQVGDGKLIRKNAKRTEALKKEYIINSLKAALGSDDKVEAVFMQMNANRNVTECESLRRTRMGKSTADA
jgi:hypothetical protein